MSNTNISICSAALLLVGADEINSFDDETREAKLCGNLYPMTLDEVLSRHPWHFSVGQAQLSQLSATPLFDYTYAYQLPTNMLRLLKEENSCPYEIYENKLYSNANTMKVLYQFRPTEARFPPYFVMLLVFEMAAILAVSLAEDEKKMEKFKALSSQYERKARNTDSQQQPSRAVREENFILTQVRL
jgi:hypothetical protein